MRLKNSNNRQVYGLAKNYMFLMTAALQIRKIKSFKEAIDKVVVYLQNLSVRIGYPNIKLPLFSLLEKKD